MSESKKTDRTAQYQTAGAGAMFLGIGVLTLILLDTMHALPWNLPRAWYVHRPLWGVIGLALCAAGWQLQRNRAADGRTWRPAIAGRRFSRLIVYSRPECHLCDDAKAVLAGYIEYLPPIEEVDIDLNPALGERFGESIPVVEIDGVARFRGRVDEVLLRRMIESTPPV